MSLVLIIGSPYLLLKAILGNHGVRERFGFIRKRIDHGRLFWFHAASVGELKIISSILPIIEGKKSEIQFAISTTTMTGRKRAARIFSDRAYVFLQPIELVSAIKRTISRLNPEKLIIVETELWPLMLKTASDNDIELFLINARMKADSFSKYKIFQRLFAPVLGGFSAVLAQSSDDAERFQSLGAENVEITGNMKYDQSISAVSNSELPLSIDNGGKMVFVAGSVRKGEDEIISRVIVECQRSDMNIGFIIVPRHMDEVQEMKETLRKHDLSFNLRSEQDSSCGLENVLLVDSMGELGGFYKIADITFVGGSLVPVGGHDPLEPAALGKPVIFGPYMENASESAEILLQSEGAEQVRTAKDIVDTIRNALADRELLRTKGERCKLAVLSMTGASEKAARIVLGESR